MLEFDRIIIQTIQSIGDGFYPIMEFFSFIGEGRWYFLIILLIAWCWNYRLGARLAIIMVFTVILNKTLKILFHAPRPAGIDSKILRYGADSFNYSGMPSGHAQDAISFWGSLAYRYRRTILWLIGTVLVVCIGISRVYLGRHFLTQVLAGWGFGILVLISYFLIEYKGYAWFSRRSKVFQILIIIIFTGITIIIGSLTMIFQKVNYEVASDSIGLLTNIIGSAGTFCGMALGIVFIKNQKKLQVKAVWWKQLIKIGILLFTYIIFEIISKIPEVLGEHELAGRFFSFLIHLGLGIWIFHVAPMLFLNLKLVQIDSIK